MRPGWDEYCMMLAELASKRSTCLRRKVGAVLVKDKQILAIGYNGAPRGIPHCIDAGECVRNNLNVPSGERMELCKAVHAEENLIVMAAYHGLSTKGATVYTTNFPCVHCAKLLINAGVKEIVYKADYPDKLSMEILRQSDILMRKFESG